MVFAGYGRGFEQENAKIIVNTVGPQMGLADLPAKFNFPSVGLPSVQVNLGQLVVTAVVRAMTTLEGQLEPCPLRMRAWRYAL